MIPARLCTIALNYSQTFLLNETVSYLAKPAEFRNKDHAYGMVGAAFLIYFGLAVSIPVISFPSQINSRLDIEKYSSRKVESNDYHFPRINCSLDLYEVPPVPF